MLTYNQQSILDYIEQVFHESGIIPNNQRIADTLNLSLTIVKSAYQSDSFVQSLSQRGIEPSRQNDLLSTEQLAGLAVFFDTKDGRSLKKKLSDCGITTQKWEAWKKQPIFQAHLRNRAEANLTNNLAETLTSITDSAHRGDINAAKLHLELSGRWSSKTVGELNVEFLMMRILEILQQRLTGQSDLLILIANDLGQLTSTSSSPNQLSSSQVTP